MFGPFKPSQPLFGGLLWKSPWRLSSTRKLRHRRRLRRVDNVVAILDNALRRKALSTAQPTTRAASKPPPAESPGPSPSTTDIPTDLSRPADSKRLLSSQTHTDGDSLRHGTGPRLGDLLPGAQRTMLRDVAAANGTFKSIERWKAEMPTEAEMLPRDKYTIFDRKERTYRKGIHKLPKWTRVSQRLNPPGF